MKRFSLFLFLSIGLLAQTPAPVSPSPPASEPTFAGFVEARAVAGNNVLGGLGVAATVASSQQVFAEIGTQSGQSVGAGSLLLIGIKSNYPAVTLSKRKYEPFSIIGYGASLSSVSRTQILSTITNGLTTTAVTTLGTSAGFAQKYAAGIETEIAGWGVGIGMSADKTSSGWRDYPLLFISRRFGK